MADTELESTPVYTNHTTIRMGFSCRLENCTGIEEIEADIKELAIAVVF